MELSPDACPEIDVETGKLLFEWQNLDRVQPEDKSLGYLEFASNRFYRICQANLRACFWIRTQQFRRP